MNQENTRGREKERGLGGGWRGGGGVLEQPVNFFRSPCRLILLYFFIQILIAIVVMI